MQQTGRKIQAITTRFVKKHTRLAEIAGLVCVKWIILRVVTTHHTIFSATRSNDFVYRQQTSEAFP